MTWVRNFAVLLLCSWQESSEPIPAKSMQEREESAIERPNVLFLMVDDLNDWTGSLEGHPQARTPQIDGLAKRGILFSNAHCSSPLCNPSRSSLLSGLAPSSTGIYQNNQPLRRALPQAETLPQCFARQGYTVLGAGKVFHNRDSSSWQEYYPSLRKSRPDDPKPKPEDWPLNGQADSGHFDWGSLDVDHEEMGDAKVAAWAAEQLHREFDRPFFLAVGFRRPHLPWYAPKPYFAAYPEKDVQLPHCDPRDLDDVPAAGRELTHQQRDHKWMLAQGQWRRAVASYLACVSFVDEMVGRVLDALQSGPHRDRTLVVFCSDHGTHLGEKLHWRKCSLWEEATRVPLIIAPPGTPSPARCSRAVSLLDLYPTLLELCGLSGPERLDGRSLVPLLEDPRREWQFPALITYRAGNHAVRSEDWRYIQYADGSEELYDHRKDPLEVHNLAAEEQYAEVRERLHGWLPEREADPAPTRPER